MKPQTAQPEINQKRRILAELRGGDFAHTGDIESIEMVLNKIKQDFPKILEGNVLDVGCGFGGTADFLAKRGIKHIWGIDNDKSVIDYAKINYKGIEFLNHDAASLSLRFKKNFFSFVFLFSVLYAIKNKDEVLQQLAIISKPGAILVLFDFSCENENEPLLDLTGKPMHPICRKTIKRQLYGAGWEVLEIRDLSEKFISWYEQLLQKLDNKKQELKGHFLEKDIAKFSETYVHILHQLRRKTLGGILIFAKRI